MWMCRCVQPKTVFSRDTLIQFRLWLCTRVLSGCVVQHGVNLDAWVPLRLRMCMTEA